ncbi:MAG: zinc ABC transporter substrate-binding protein [Candidatus Pacebacteria bacterium]|nr:zinc ABC transporter substrate-binding protein [Candidatus Paceibacterota bacterium]
MNKRYIFGLCLLGIVILIVTVFVINLPNRPLPQTKTEKLSVVTSFYPLYFFSEQIGGDKAEIINITPAGAEPHDYEPSPQDIISITKGKLLILNGGGLEAWGPKVIHIIDPNHTLVVTAGEGLAMQEFKQDEQTVTDPHIWLSPRLAQKMVDKITEGFVKADPANSGFYTQNSELLKIKLNVLDQEYQTGLNVCASRNIVTSHSAFGYLAMDYNLNQVPITGLSLDAEPSLKKLGEIAKFAKDNKVKYIFFESLVSPKLSDVIATEIGAKTMVLDPIEGLTPDAIKLGRNYLSVMRDNLANLEIALECAPMN